LDRFEIKARVKTNIEILEQIQAEQKSIYALEHMLGYHINELEELRPHKRDIRFIAQSDYDDQPDLVVLSRWLEREKNVETSIKKNEKIITKIYDKLYAQIILKMLEGEELKPLDIFFYHLKKYIKKIRTGEISLHKLVGQYDWDNQKFKE